MCSLFIINSRPGLGEVEDTYLDNSLKQVHLHEKGEVNSPVAY